MIKQKIKSEHFYKFFICPHWIWYDIYEDQKKHKHIPLILEMVYKGKIQDPKGILPTKEFEEIKSEFFKDLDEAFLATLELMKQGKNIYKPVLMFGNWVGEPDFIEARPITEVGNINKSDFGDFYYVAYNIHNDLELKDEYKFPLIFISLILEKIQGVRPKEAFIIDADGRIKSFLVESFIDRFNLSLKIIEKILDGEKPPPFLKSGCKRTPWYSLCEEETTGCEDVSLVFGLSQMDQKSFYDLGIKKVSQLAEADINKLYDDLRTWNFDKLVRLQNQARSLINQEVLILKKPEFPKVINEIYFDIESDPTRGIDYLFGILLNKNGSVKYKYWFAGNKAGEKKMWQKFLEFIDGLEDFVIYHYGYYEKHVINRLERKYGAFRDSINKFNSHSFDLYKILIDAVVMPLYFYSLKDVAGYLGYKWSQKDFGGAESVIWYDAYLKTKDKKILDSIIRYNQDDVRATFLIKRWLEKQRPKLKTDYL